jgi:hypothetical protein
VLESRICNDPHKFRGTEVGGVSRRGSGSIASDPVVILNTDRLKKYISYNILQLTTSQRCHWHRLPQVSDVMNTAHHRSAVSMTSLTWGHPQKIRFESWISRRIRFYIRNGYTPWIRAQKNTRGRTSRDRVPLTSQSIKFTILSFRRVGSLIVSPDFGLFMFLSYSIVCSCLSYRILLPFVQIFFSCRKLKKNYM